MYYKEETPNEKCFGLPRPNLEDLVEGMVLIYDPPYALEPRWEALRGTEVEVNRFPEVVTNDRWDIWVNNPGADFGTSVWRLPNFAFKLLGRNNPSWEV